MASNHRVDLLIPGLFGPVSFQTGDSVEAPTLSRLLGRADRVPAPADDPLADLMARFGISPGRATDLPSAPFCHLADTGGLGTGDFVFHAEPVHLRLDRDRLVLFDSRVLGLTQGEAVALTERFNEQFARDGLRLDVPRPGRWYLRVASRPQILTSPLHEVVGRSMNALLPRGPDQAVWGRILNETQMLFHHSGVNRDREKAGRWAVSGIWPWGGGRLSEWSAQSDYQLVFGEDPLTLGLASAAAVRAENLPDDVGELFVPEPAGNRLLCWHPLWDAVLGADGRGWSAELRRLEQWLLTLPACMKRNTVGHVDLDACDGRCFRLHRWGLRRFWRSPYAIGRQVGGAT